MLLAAGLGTRLRPLTDLRPKPIVPLANKPLASFAMEHLARCGVSHIVANTHPKPEFVEETLRDACPSEVELRFSRESTLLGTGGGLRRARRLFDDPGAQTIVMNADTLFGPNLQVALDQHLAREAVATMILRRTPDPARFGAIGVDDSGRVRSLLGTPQDAAVRELLMFTGVHVLSPLAFSAMPESGCVIRTAYRHWVDRGLVVLGVIDESPWADLGTVSEYHRLNMELASGDFSWPGIEPRAGSILPPDLKPSERIRQCVIAPGARLRDGVALDRCVVWPDTVVERDASRAVLTPAGVVPASVARATRAP